MFASRIPRLISFLILISRFLRWLLSKLRQYGSSTKGESSLPRESKKLVLVRPEDRLVLLHIHTGHDVMQMHDDILGPISNHYDKASLLFLYSIANERGDARITVCWSIYRDSRGRTVLDIHCLANHDSSTEYQFNCLWKAACAQPFM